jgi:hypothetical protein
MDGLETAYNAVLSWFDARGGGVECSFGFDAAERFHENTNARCAFVPGDPTRIMCGPTVTNTDTLDNAPNADRSFALINERFQIIVSAFDPRDEADKWRQYRAVKLLHRKVREALFASADYLWITRVDWIPGSKLFAHGLALRLLCEAQEFQTITDNNGDQFVFPWTARTRVYIDDVFVEQIDSPPQDP